MKSRGFLSRFSRVTTSGKFISEIDGLRFIAIGIVVLFHIGASAIFADPTGTLVGGRWLVYIVREGAHGVELFFMISGFILALPFASHALKEKPQVNLRKYFLRRLTRLEPPYMLAMFLFFLMAVFLKGENWNELFPHLLASLAYVHNLVYKAASPINDVAWSLEVEIQFYLLVPLLAGVFFIKRKWIRRGLIVAVSIVSTVHAWLFIGPADISYLTIVRFIQFFLLGFLLADVYLTDWNSSPSMGFGWDVISFLGWPLLFLVWNELDSSGIAGHASIWWGVISCSYPLIAFFLYLAAFRGPIFNRFFTNPWITTLGGMCYSIYLIHNHIIGVIERATRHLAFTNSYVLNFAIESVIIIPAIVIASSIYFALIEKPCMRSDWPQRAYARVLQFFM